MGPFFVRAGYDINILPTCAVVFGRRKRVAHLFDFNV
jgi:hypothetical protein